MSGHHPASTATTWHRSYSSSAVPSRPNHSRSYSGQPSKPCATSAHTKPHSSATPSSGSTTPATTSSPPVLTSSSPVHPSVPVSSHTTVVLTSARTSGGVHFPATSSARSSGPALANTGADPGPWAAGGVSLLIFGALLLGLARMYVRFKRGQHQ